MFSGFTYLEPFIWLEVKTIDRNIDPIEYVYLRKLVLFNITETHANY